MPEILLKPVITIPNEKDHEKAEKIMIQAERACLISNSITFEVHLETKVLISEIRLLKQEDLRVAMAY